MTYFEISMYYEREYGIVSGQLTELQSKRSRYEEEARAQGKTPNQYYTEEIKKLKAQKNAFRKLSDDAFKEHKRTHDVINTEGAIELANAILTKAAQDYEEAICEKNEKSKQEIEDFAEEHGYLYTELDVPGILSRIRTDQKRFAKKAHNDIFSIIETTNTLRRKRLNMNDESNPHNCPLCGGKMFIKTRTKTDTYMVGCTGCMLTEVVTIRS